MNTKQKILAAARSLFVKHGFAGSSIGNIAKSADVNRSLIFHHFGNKENLWIAVKQDIVEQASRDKPLVPSCELPFAEFLTELFHSVIRFLRNNNDITRLLNWQRLEYNEKVDIGLTESKTAKLWLEALGHYQQKGDIDAKYRLNFVMTFIVPIMNSIAIDPNIYVKSEQDFEDFIAFSVQIIIKALQPCQPV